MRLVLLLLLFLAAPAGALTIQIDSVSLGAGNTADSANNASATEILTASDSVPDVTGGPFAEVDAHWQGSVWADDALASATADWQITFTVIANPGVVYNLVILQELAGAFTFLDDSVGNATGSIGELTGTLAGLPNPLLTMPVGVDGTATSATTASVPFQRSRLLELEALVGTQTFTLGFTFGVERAEHHRPDRGAARAARSDRRGGLSGHRRSRCEHRRTPPLALDARDQRTGAGARHVHAALHSACIGSGGRRWRR